MLVIGTPVIVYAPAAAFSISAFDIAVHDAFGVLLGCDVYATYTTTDVTPVEGAADTLSSGSSSRTGGDGAVEVEAAPAVGAIASAVQLLPAGTLTIWPGWP